MKKVFAFGLAVMAGSISSAAFADSNASGGGVTNSQTVSVPGSFNHDGAVGATGNSTASVTFTGGFNANRVRFSGTNTSVATGNWQSDIQIRVTNPGATDSMDWSAGGGNTTYSTFQFNNPNAFGPGDFGGSIDPAGTWNLEFWENFEDDEDPGDIDSITSDLSMTFEQATPVTDSNGVFTGPSFNTNPFQQYSSVGEFAVAFAAGANGNHDRYTFSLAQDGLIYISTTAQPGFTGITSGDTEIGVFDAAGNIVTDMFDDDDGAGTYSFIAPTFLTAGTYTLVVGAWDTNFDNTSTLSNLTFGSSVFDYGLVISYAIPEPTSALILGSLAVAGLVVRRRRA